MAMKTITLADLKLTDKEMATIAKGAARFMVPPKDEDASEAPPGLEVTPRGSVDE